MKAKDWISIPVSIIALLIAGFTAYFTFLRQADDLSVVVEGYRRFEIDKGTKSIATRPDYTMTFANAGTRAAMVRIFLSLSQTAEMNAQLDCDKLPLNWTSFDIDPFVVKPGDVLIQRVRLKDGIIRAQNIDPKPAQSKVTVLTCAGFSVITPDSARKLIAVELDRSTFDVKLGVPIVPEGDYDADRLPATLVKKRQLNISEFGFQ
jgi:hypothetical protein